jgi:hypothetical protein
LARDIYPALAGSQQLRHSQLFKTRININLEVHIFMTKSPSNPYNCSEVSISSCSLFTTSPNMATALLSILHALQASFSAYTLYLSSISIRNLQKYEETSKKVAKYSSNVEQQLHKTRTTQASGALSVPSLFPLPKKAH